ncbi:MAG: Gfo/Idh/MocA family oxidoreductase [Nanoarchaeota archaeon]|nr:Gfo/Idh/MocA family oxidoreductase [Nanoarchaeota archaeon]MBU1704207.1 Gfo/Idh/MocA family oxidoreductase [Nanoarchaeota archaeon]
MLNAAVIGAGSMGRNHARIYSYLDNVKLVAIADRDSSRGEVAESYGTKFYSDYEEMLDNEEIDIVSVVVPTHLHKEVALKVISKKVNILLEKPIAINSADGADIINAASKNNVKLMIGHIERFNPAIIELKKKIHELGRIYKIDVQRIGPFPARISDVGVIADLSVHDIDVISYLIEKKLIRVCAETQQKIHPNHEDSLIALLRYENEIIAELNVNYLSPKKIREIMVFGEKGMFKANYLTQDLGFYENPSYNQKFDNVTEGKGVSVPVEKKEPLLAEIEAFVRCVEKDEKVPITGEDGLYAIKVAELLLKSAKSSIICKAF